MRKQMPDAVNTMLTASNRKEHMAMYKLLSNPTQSYVKIAARGRSLFL